MAPEQSVLYPTHSIPSFTTVLTAPIFRAVSSTRSNRGMICSFAGMVTLNPLKISLKLLKNFSVDPKIREVIVATNASVEGEATSVYLEQEIRPLGPRVTRLARGIPVGSDLEYVDGTTIAQALAGRREI